MAVKWGASRYDPASAVTTAVMTAVDRVLQTTPPENRYSAAISGLLAAVLLTIVQERDDATPANLPSITSSAAEALVTASHMLARTLAQYEHNQTN